MIEKNIFRKTNTSLTREDIKMMSPLQLAYVGDACYELMVRTFLLDKNLSVNILHKKTTGYVKAKSQSLIVHKLEEILNEQEKDIVRKGRNTKSNSNPKNANLIEYKYATGFEALFGYLYLTNQDERLAEIFNFIIQNED
ncbi:Mini-ribonuclease 3 [Tissierella creatinophila]|nr:ribonuclease III domain-containing protein [Tissierella creatinophila]